MAAAAETVVAFDWKHPDYTSTFAARVERLRRLRADPRAVSAFKTFYADNPVRFIADWGVTFDPRNAERGLPTSVPFVPWPRQVEYLHWILDRWHAGENGLVEKARDSGCSWLAIALSCTLCLFHRGLVIGFGSRKLEYVDQVGAPKSLFEKARFFLSHLPPEFLGGWTRDRYAPYTRILFPGTGSAMTGEGGDGIGRGDRCSLYVVDEAAFLEHPQLTDASLARTTNCRIDISTPNSMANPFAIKRHSGRVKVFTMTWRDDPRRDEAWYRRQVEQLDPVTLAQEIDINYAASAEGVVIPSTWVQAAVGAHLKLGIKPTGGRFAGLDVADEGVDLNAMAGRHGIVLQHLAQWSGKGGDIYQTVVRAFALCDEHGYETVDFDSDGLGAGVRGDAENINTQREAAGRPRIYFSPFRGSGAVQDPDDEVAHGSGSERTNADFYANFKAQSWWALRARFQATYRAVVEGLAYEADDLISISPDLPDLSALLVELSQPTYSINAVGKLLIEKKPDGTRSPNLADAVMICYQPGRRWMETWLKLV